jgi:hypothetical protein
MYYLVMLGDTNGLKKATADADCVGALQNKPKTGEAGLVALGETTKVILGGDVSFKAELVSDDDGKAITRTTEHNIIGVALEGGVAGDVIEMLVKKVYK